MPALMCHIHNKLFPLHTSQKKTSYKNKNYLALFSKTRTAVCSFSLFSHLRGRLFPVKATAVHCTVLLSFCKCTSQRDPKQIPIEVDTTSKKAAKAANWCLQPCKLALSASRIWSLHYKAFQRIYVRFVAPAIFYQPSISALGHMHCRTTGGSCQVQHAACQVFRHSQQWWGLYKLIFCNC